MNPPRAPKPETPMQKSTIGPLFIAATIAIGAISCKQSPHSPNVLVIVVDTLRADRLDAVRNGVPTMPKLSRHALEATVFDSAIAQSSWTKPSMVSLFTSLYAETHGVLFGLSEQFDRDNSALVDALPAKMESMAAYFKGHGYATAGVQTNPHLQATFGFAQGFDRYEFLKSSSAQNVTDTALQVLPASPGPYFLYAHYIDPHGPYAPPNGYADIFGPAGELSASGKAALDDWENTYERIALHRVDPTRGGPPPEISQATRTELQRRYDGEVRYVDGEIVRLIDSVLARDPNTVIVFTADHGEEFWEHGELGHGRTLYQELIHVPLFIRFPDAKPARIETPVETIDVLPTLAARLGLPARAHWQGRDIAAPGLVARPAFSATGGSLRNFDLKLASVREGGFKMICSGVDGACRLYNIDTDPGESRDLFGEESATTKRLADELARQSRANQSNPYYSTPKSSAPLDEETRRELGAIGYIQ